MDEFMFTCQISFIRIMIFLNKPGGGAACSTDILFSNKLDRLALLVTYFNNVNSTTIKKIRVFSYVYFNFTVTYKQRSNL